MMINRIEELITLLLNDFLTKGNQTEICLNRNYCSNIYNLNDETRNVNEEDDEDGGGAAAAASTTRGNELAVFDKLYYRRLSSRQRFAMFLYVLAEVHDLFLARSYCTYRELYYRNVEMMGGACNQLQIQRAVDDVCGVMETTSWNLGIFAAGKGFIAGPVRIHMTNGDVIDCSNFKGPTMLPPNFTYIDRFDTTAQIVVVVEKNTVFQKLIANDIFSLMEGNIILITARGYPDISTRWILHKLWLGNHLQVYVLVDGDPFGIEIMLIYRHGSIKQMENSYQLNCPELKWLGIHPSDFQHIIVAREPLARNDYRKIDSLLSRQYVEEEIRHELFVLRQQKHKVKIDNMSVYSFSVFINDYIVNKIKRQIVI